MFQKNIKDTFKQMNIDMCKRLNESRNLYSFAFINIELMDTPKLNGSTQLYYDDEYYWELMNYANY
jgi:hypothetical protein